MEIKRKILLAYRFEETGVTSDQLTNTLQSKYGLSKNECNQVLQNIMNSKDVDMKVGTFDKQVRLRRRG